MPADLRSLTIVMLLGRYEHDAAVPVTVVVPVDERGDPLTGLIFGCKGLTGIIRPVLYGPEQLF